MSILKDPGFRRRLGYLCLGLAIGFILLAFFKTNRPRSGPGLFSPPPQANPVQPAPKPPPP